MGKCKQINNSNLPYVSDIISLIIHKRNCTISSMLCWPLGNLQINNVTPVSSLHEALKKNFPTLFGGIGQLKDVTVKLHINTSIQPVAQQPRWASSLSCQTESERGIKNLVSKGIIEKVDGPHTGRV